MLTGSLGPLLPQGATPAQVLVVLGLLEYAPRYRDHEARVRIGNGLEVWSMLQDAVKHKGLSRIERRRFIGGLRTGKPGPALLKRAQEICELIGPAELQMRFERISAWATLRETGRLPPGWVWREPGSTLSSAATINKGGRAPQRKTA